MRHPLLNDNDYGPRKTFPGSLPNLSTFSFSQFHLPVCVNITGRTDRWPTSREFVNVLTSGEHGMNDGDIATGQLLHAHYFEFDHPVTNLRMTFTAPLPKAFARVVLWLRENASISSSFK
jgi:23S rRNA-/tRNA-specific pseudouridylate synthase